MAFEFIPATDERTRFIVDIPKPGGGHVTFNVPLISFLDEATFRAYRDWSNKNPEEELLKAGKRPVAEHFDWLVKHLKIDNAAWFTSHLVFGEKKQLWDEWNRRSLLPLGESSASSSD